MTRHGRQDGKTIGQETVPGLERIFTLRDGPELIRRIMWAPAGCTIAAPRSDGTIVIWDAEHGTAVRKIVSGEKTVYSVAWSPDGQTLAVGGDTGDIALWSVRDGQLIGRLHGPSEWVNTLAWSSTDILASGSEDGCVRLWDIARRSYRELTGHRGNINGLAWSSDGVTLCSGSGDSNVALWDGPTGKLLCMLRGHRDWAFAVAWAPGDKLLVSASIDATLRVWDPLARREDRVLEGHSAKLSSVSFIADGRLLASKSSDGTVRLWRCDRWQCAAILAEPSSGRYSPSLAFHPSKPLLATLDDRDTALRIWRVDPASVLGAGANAPTYYRSAKVVLVGDTGVGKSGLATVLTGQAYREMESSHGRNVLAFDLSDQQVDDGREIRETFLWDLAGQPGYRLVNQMSLREVSVALVVFDARSEVDPLAGVRHWVRALKQAAERQGTNAVPLTMFLVIGRSDRTGVALSNERIENLQREMGFRSCHKTSAREGWGVALLATAIREAIPWTELPLVSSTELLWRLRHFILDEIKAGRLLCTGAELLRMFQRTYHGFDDGDLGAQFDTCIGRLENRDLVRRLSFGGQVLLQPQLLDAYASAIVDAAKTEPDGLGSILEADCLRGVFQMSADARLRDGGQEELVLLATVKELLEHDLALREHADGGTYLVFPSQCLRDWPAAIEPPGKAFTCHFEGPVQNLYSTLAVRLAHSEFFATERDGMWRNAILFRAKHGGQCRIFLNTFDEGTGTLTLSFDKDATTGTRLLFKEYVVAHLERRALSGSLRVERAFVCEACGTPVPETYAAILQRHGRRTFECACGGVVSLADAEAPLADHRAQLTRMDKAADESRDRAVAAMTLQGKMKTSDFDVLLCHNDEDKEAVKKIGNQLKAFGILPWLDEWNLRPGFPWQQALQAEIRNIKAAAVFIGPDGLGPWQSMELHAVIAKFIKRGAPVIPVFLDGLEATPDLPPFLESFQAVDFRKPVPDPMDQLIWGITGHRHGSGPGADSV